MAVRGSQINLLDEVDIVYDGGRQDFSQIFRISQQLSQSNFMILSQPGQEIVLNTSHFNDTPRPSLPGSQMSVGLGALQPLFYDSNEISPSHTNPTIDSNNTQRDEDAENMDLSEALPADRKPQAIKGRLRGRPKKILQVPAQPKAKKSTKESRFSKQENKRPQKISTVAISINALPAQLRPNFFSPAPDGWKKPPFTFTLLIALALNSTENRRMSVDNMYLFFKSSFPFFAYTKIKWKNSLRHNLSLERCYVKTETHRTPKKGYEWTFNPKRSDWLEHEVTKRAMPITQLSHCLAEQGVLTLLLALQMAK